MTRTLDGETITWSPPPAPELKIVYPARPVWPNSAASSLCNVWSGHYCVCSSTVSDRPRDRTGELMREASDVDDQRAGQVCVPSPDPPVASRMSAYLVADFLRCQAGLPSESVLINALKPADSPRLEGENDEHIRVLAASEAVLPPIVVHRSTMRVIDGMHRLKAATLRGQDRLEVRFFDGDDEAAFVLAVQANVCHGLPLSLSDRTAAARRILDVFPNWSDRKLAELAGVSPKTVGAIRGRSTEEIPHLTTRIGRDGRIRPVDGGHHRLGTESTERALYASLSADATELAPRTSPPSTGEPRATLAATINQKAQHLLPLQRRRSAPAQVSSMVSALRKDPSLRFTDSGRLLLRLLESHSLPPQTWDQLLSAVPPHCADRVAELALHYSFAWHSFASRLAGERSEI